MSIDILTYELKYKNDPMVLDLIREFQVSQEFLNAENDEMERCGGEIDDLKSTISEHEELKGGWQEEIDRIIDILNDDLDGEKVTLKYAMEKAVKELNALGDRMI